MLDFLKVIIDKLRLDLLLAALGLSILLFKLCGFDTWWMIFTFCSSYLILLWGEYFIKACKKRQSEIIENEARCVQQKAHEEYINEQIWKRFYSMDESDLNLVKTVYLSERDPHNPSTRFIRNNPALKYQIEEKSEFRVPIGDRRYCPILHSELIGNTTVVTFHPYFERLVSHFVVIGRIERI